MPFFNWAVVTLNSTGIVFVSFFSTVKVCGNLHTNPFSFLGISKVYVCCSFVVFSIFISMVFFFFFGSIFSKYSIWSWIFVFVAHLLYFLFSFQWCLFLYMGRFFQKIAAGHG